ncbi:dihydroorotate oxidase [Oceanivirga miroungae]|uniref:dihydroorotate oxidase (fumarate) n=1 Tax=Oceanivirga miroungae TaxID=1130046 RepID=A0A6I8MBD3_9FUSO|nr:dihydroorotate oxidase [Oceanivirga miroungae]VWL85510.1 dihydroorotate dehydrogenase 1A [Oceanivirga miroungae]
MNLKVKIKDFEFENPLMNAAGVNCYTIDELEEIRNSKAASFVTKTCTLNTRQGNLEPRYYENELGSINSMGLPNLGIDYYLNYLESLDGTYFLSVTEMNTENIHKILEKINESSFNGLVELNLSCPNIEGKPQIAYDFKTTDKLLADIFKYFKKDLGVKLPPYFDLAHFDIMANILNKYPIRFVNSINSIGNAIIIDENDTVVIKPKNGFGGLGGEYIKPTALANVNAFYRRLNKDIKIIGTGGVNTGRDVYEHILCGAYMVQIGTRLQKEKSKVFERILNELKEIMKEKNYNSLDEFRGKLKTL